MGLNRFAKRKDISQEAIVRALRKAGVKVWILDTPCDLLTMFPDKYGIFRWLPLECKPPKNARYTALQTAFLTENQVPVVTSPEEALRAVGVI